MAEQSSLPSSSSPPALFGMVQPYEACRDGRSVDTKGSDSSSETARHARPYQLMAQGSKCCMILYFVIQTGMKRTCKQLLARGWVKARSPGSAAGRRVDCGTPRCAAGQRCPRPSADCWKRLLISHIATVDVGPVESSPAAGYTSNNAEHGIRTRQSRAAQVRRLLAYHSRPCRLRGRAQ
jgi:hypothetical protein